MIIEMELNAFISKSFICDRHCGSVLAFKNCLLENSAIAEFVDDFYVTQNGRKVNDSDEAILGETYRFHPRLVGGKGGFGSMLRALGAQIEKTTNREACRDLSGRRMRDVNNEKKLKEWIEKAPERERLQREKEEEKKKKMKKEEAKYFFDSTAYDQQKEKIREHLEEAMKQVPGNIPVKRKADIDPSKAKMLFGDDLGSDNDDTDDEDDVPSHSKKAKLELKENDKIEISPEERNVEKEERKDDVVVVQNTESSVVEDMVPEISSAEEIKTHLSEDDSSKADDSQVHDQSSS